MKIVQIDVNYSKSSTGKIVETIHKYNLNNGIESYVLYGRGEKIDYHNVVKFGIDMETKIHALLTRITGLTGYFSYFSTRKLIKNLDKIKPDILHIHELHAYFINIGSIINYIKSKKIPTVMTLHCEFIYTGKCGHAINCDKWKKNCGKCPLNKEYPKSLFFDFTNFMHKRKKKYFSDFSQIMIVTPSIWLNKRVELSFFRNKKSIVINNGIDTSKIHYNCAPNFMNEFGINSNKTIILSIAPDIMSRNKGGEWVISLARIMDSNDFHFIIIGNKEEIINPPPNVTALGLIYDPKTVSKFYSNSDYFLICSERETFPTTCIESLICGTPILGFNTGGIPEIAPDNLGFFVEYGDIKSIKSFLVANNRGFFKERNEIIDYAINKFSNDQMYSKYNSLYKNIYESIDYITGKQDD